MVGIFEGCKCMSGAVFVCLDRVGCVSGENAGYGCATCGGVWQGRQRQIGRIDIPNFDLDRFSLIPMALEVFLERMLGRFGNLWHRVQPL